MGSYQAIPPPLRFLTPGISSRMLSLKLKRLATMRERISYTRLKWQKWKRAASRRIAPTNHRGFRAAPLVPNRSDFEFKCNSLEFTGVFAPGEGAGGTQSEWLLGPDTEPFSTSLRCEMWQDVTRERDYTSLTNRPDGPPDRAFGISLQHFAARHRRVRRRCDRADAWWHRTPTGPGRRCSAVPVLAA